MNDSKPAPLYSLQRPLRWIWHFQYTEWSHKKTSLIEARTLHGDKILIFLIALCFLQVLSTKKSTYWTVYEWSHISIFKIGSTVTMILLWSKYMKWTHFLPSLERGFVLHLIRCQLQQIIHIMSTLSSYNPKAPLTLVALQESISGHNEQIY